MLNGNTATAHGGGDYVGTLNNCTMIGNEAARGGGSNGGTLKNCIVWGNSATDLGPEVYSANCYNTCVSVGITDGINNCITNNPLFIDSTSGNYRLLSTSPCVDSGNSASVVVATDLDGNPRITLSAVDMGAYEYIGNIDTDGDGFTDSEEYIAGTSSSDSDDYFHISGIDGNTVESESLSDRAYFLYWSTNLVDDILTLAGVKYGIGGPDSITGSSSAPTKFFKLKVSKP